MRKASFHTALLAVVLAGSLTAGDDPFQEVDAGAVKARLDAVANSYTTDNVFMGSILVADGDQVLLDKGYGMANLEWNIPNTPEAKFRIASLTKQFTAAIVLLLQDEGKLRIEDAVGKYLPDAPAHWGQITLAELLGHTSGIPDLTNEKEFEAWSMNPRTHAEEFAFFRDKPLEFQPGSQYRYSSSGFLVLGLVIEKVSGRSYADLLHERILEPLGMKETGLDTDDLILDRRAQGYRKGADGLKLARSESLSVPWAAGGMYSTSRDLLRWERGLFGGKVLSDTSLKMMTTAGKGNYGLGVDVLERYGMKVVSHSGGIEGFSSYLCYQPDRRLAVAVLGNVGGSSAGIAMAFQLMSVALGKPVVLLTDHKAAASISKEESSKLAGVYDSSPYDGRITMSVIIAVSSDGLTIKTPNGRETPLIFEGFKDGRPQFFSRIPIMNTVIEFAPDSSGSVPRLVAKFNATELTFARRR